MKELSYQKFEPYTFGGLEGQSFVKSRVAVLPVPYDSTCYWKSGTKNGPKAIIDASRALELYDEETGKDISKVGICTLPELQASKNSPKETILRIEKAIGEIIKKKKFVLTLGGEHSITLGAVSAFKKVYPNLSVLQLDAHTDLRNEFEGTKYSHACVMKRIRDLNIPVVQAGIRSMSSEEAAYLKKVKEKNIFLAKDFPWDGLTEKLTDKVYLTIDLDVLDPSIMPAVGTPEPGGLGWYDILEIIKKLSLEKKIVGVDIVELDPIPGVNFPDFTAAKLAYKIINYVFK